MTQTEPQVKASMVLKGRSMEVRRLKDAQLMLMAKEAQVVTRKDVSLERRLLGVTRLMDILESAIVNEADRDFITDLNIKGELELSDLTSVLNVLKQDEPEEKPVVRRGRPRKTAV